ncbi:MAG: DUF4858 domain-containing protein [Bacteroidaceae bacterium]|nr:DUF4858 domain-containing protein [Bacteroidaceae bacterium]
MEKRFTLLLMVTSLSVSANAQWTVKDSLNIQRIMKSGEELKLNEKVIKQIDFGGMVGNPGIFREKRTNLFDETLPSALPKAKVVLTLSPYKMSTRYDWDPVYQKKILIDKHTWQENISGPLIPSNWAKTPMEGGVRKSYEEIRTSGVNFSILSERANGVYVNSVVMNPSCGIRIGKSVYISGSTIGGMDLMAIFEKKFWDRRGANTRERTLEVLKSYGDSTIVMINQPIMQMSQ